MEKKKLRNIKRQEKVGGEILGRKWNGLRLRILLFWSDPKK